MALLATAAIFMTTACSPIALLNAAVPSSGYQITHSIAYGDFERNALDVYVPRAPTDEPRPVVVFFYGGSWEAGKRDDYEFVAEALTSQGFVVVVPDYRVYPEVKFPDFMLDAAAAVQWTKHNIEQYGGDAEQVFVMGHSAGAHIAAMLTLNADYLARVELQPQDLAGMVGLAGPYDFLPLSSDRLKAIFGPEEERWKSQPINFVTGKNPPMLLLVGTDDKSVWPKNSYNLAAKITAAGGPVKVIDYPGWGHVDMVAKLAKPLRQQSLLQPIVQFIQVNAGCTSTAAMD